jgi:hypothetical protein
LNIYDGLSDRLKKIYVIKLLGEGFQLEDLQDNRVEITLLLLLKIMKLEILDNENRTKSDLINYAKEITNQLGLKSNNNDINRLVDGIISYKDPKMGNSFKSKIFNEETNLYEDFSFRYLISDKNYSQWEKGGKTVYKLHNISKEMIFLTRDIIEEFEFDVEQFYTLQLIKSGNFNKAKSSVNNLLLKVRKLIEKENEYKEDILNNPKNIFLTKKNKIDIQKQFDEEQKVFDKIFKWKNRIVKMEPKARKEAIEVFANLEKARRMHDRLVAVAVKNFELEVRIRKEYPLFFCKTTTVSFKNDIWQDKIDSVGLKSFDCLEKLISPIFSPEISFVYPLDWAWQNQILSSTYLRDKQKIEVEYEKGWEKKDIDFDLLIECFKFVFDKLVKNKEICISEFDSMDEELKEKWLRKKINFELLMMFIMTDIKLKLGKFSDNRLKIFNLLCEYDDKYKELNGKIITSKLYGEPIKWNEIEISGYKLFLKGDINE